MAISIVGGVQLKNIRISNSRNSYTTEEKCESSYDSLKYQNERTEKELISLKKNNIDCNKLYEQMKDIILYVLQYSNGDTNNTYNIEYHHDCGNLNRIAIYDNSNNGSINIHYRYNIIGDYVKISIDSYHNPNNVPVNHMNSTNSDITFFYVKYSKDYKKFVEKIIKITNEYNHTILDNVYNSIMQKTGGMREKNLKIMLED